jgi:hypothetical protein
VVEIEHRSLCDMEENTLDVVQGRARAATRADERRQPGGVRRQ